MTKTSIAPLTPRKLTFEQYLLLPYDGRKTEFVNGEIVEMAEPGALHIKVVKRLGRKIDHHIETHQLEFVCFSGPGIQIPQVGRRDGARDSDLVVATHEQWQQVEAQTKALFLRQNPPLIAIEVVSPGTVKVDTCDKRADYADARVPEYWVVNPVDSYVAIWVLDGRMYRLLGEFRGDETVNSELPHWELAASDMLAG
ncbi:MAG: Uma2 family endonuclease [Leptolyngbyaceae cyanobacterium SM1_1_3]|nr:Uma2 family endonuclease [Leptolyngbyaceae cyanobacterium SM1_1_3]NJN04400.1 Uma2 family endonuclease [Leptolyngbyaceae cyanobacterium RM1_1_2]NJO11926.1 Uma2 family endonuclease [Leptolyngbyaceae cyanobacterium SL_1_1]